MSTNIYRDQENRVPVHPRRVKGDETKVTHWPNDTQNISTFATKRTVLSTININSSVRIQPKRAAKQGVSYDSGLHTSSNENDFSKSSKSSQTSILPFTIHEDSSSTSSTSSSASSLRPHSTALTNTSTDTKEVSTSSSTCNFITAACCNTLSSRPKLKDTYLRNIISSPVKNKPKGKAPPPDNNNKENEDPNKAKCGGRVFSSIESPEEMDVSICDTFSMVVDSPIVPREDVLHRRDDDFWDVPEYAADIYNYLRDAELCHKPRPNYMSKQTDITASMRWILVDWLVEVSEEYSLHTETLYLAVSYIDRFLSHMSVKRDKLQLVGTTAMFIASKYEEIYPPDVSQFAYITDNTYRVSQILRMEHLILKVLSFDMAVPTAFLFVNKFAKMCRCNEETLHLALYISELSMLDSDPFLRYLPSQIAASAVAIANFTQGRPVWPDEISIQSRYTLDDLRECYVNLYRAYCRVSECQTHAIRDKYKSSKWSSASNITPREGLPW